MEQMMHQEIEIEEIKQKNKKVVFNPIIINPSGQRIINKKKIENNSDIIDYSKEKTIPKKVANDQTFIDSPQEKIIMKKKIKDFSENDSISIIISSNVSLNESQKSNQSFGKSSKSLKSSGKKSSKSSGKSSKEDSSNEFSQLIDLSEASLDAEIFGANDYDDSQPYQNQIDKGIIIKKFYHYKPQINQKYFESPKINDDIKRGISVIIPFYNEEGFELQQTLHSLYDAHLRLREMSKKWTDEPLYVCLIQDGWTKASKSMKNYLKHLFPKQLQGQGWWTFFPELSGQSNKDLNMNATFIFERENNLPTVINPQSKFSNEPKFMNITLIIKANNRRKHNSHEWFLSETGFAEVTKGKYLLLTDAFTLYSKNCLYYLVNDLDKNQNLSGITGRQRLMTREQQGCKESAFSFAFILRMIQLYDFEYSNAGYNGGFALGGYMPVIPGPCGLYRASDILQNNVRLSYFNLINAEPCETGILLANVKTAEDRVLSCYSATKTKDGKLLGFNPLAVFYFESEQDLEQLNLQRRRWVNGSVAGYIELLFSDFETYKNWNVSIIRKIYIWILLMSQFIIYCLVGIAPGISMRVFYYGINYFMAYYNVVSDVFIYLLFGAIWVLYILHVTIHHNNKFNYIIFYVLVLFSLLTSLTLWAALFHYVFIEIHETIPQSLQYAHPVVYMAIAVFILQFVCGLALSGKMHSFMYMIKSFIIYLLFVPLLIAWFASYAYSRIWDVSWGNRVTETNDMSAEQKDIMISQFKEKSLILIGILISLNTAVFFIPLSGQLYIMSIFFTIALFQMFFSLIYCATKINYRFKMARKVTQFKNKKKHAKIPPPPPINPEDNIININAIN